MNQATLSFPSIASAGTEPADRIGFDIGWDHAHLGLVPPAELLHAGTPVLQGWMAGKAVFGRRTHAGPRAARQWLALRLVAWKQGILFDSQQLDVQYFARIHTDRCPVRRQPLGGSSGHDDAMVVERLNPHSGYAAGNLVVLSQAAAKAWLGLEALALVHRARASPGAARLAAVANPGVWWRLAVLRCFATALPFYVAARLPLALLPPERVRLVNAVQGLQVLVSCLFLAPGWAVRCRQLSQLLPEQAPRHDFHLLVGAIAPRVLEAGRDPQHLRPAVEDAWLDDRVQRRWQHWVLSLGQTAVEALLDRAIQAGLGGRLIPHHAAGQAGQCWSLEQPSRAASAKRSLTGAQGNRRLAHRQPLDNGFALHRVGPASKGRHRLAMLVGERDVVDPGPA